MEWYTQRNNAAEPDRINTWYTTKHVNHLIGSSLCQSLTHISALPWGWTALLIQDRGSHWLERPGDNASRTQHDSASGLLCTPTTGDHNHLCNTGTHPSLAKAACTSPYTEDNNIHTQMAQPGSADFSHTNGFLTGTWETCDVQKPGPTDVDLHLRQNPTFRV